ncbi:MAG: aldehyde dehydrogenase family protein [Burkholderiales bacterium]|nr:aldehyde dehydrogenase family protein [Burkholderiales bacterium]
MINTNLTKLYISGKWVDPVNNSSNQSDFITINPATAKPSGSIKMGSADDVDLAVTAAKAAFPNFSNTSIGYRRELLEKIISIYEKRLPEITAALTLEMGAPVTLAKEAQAMSGLINLKTNLEAFDNFEFCEKYKDYKIVKESIGVCGLITPWNWPINQITLKVGPAIAAGCTMVLKPSEYSAFSAQIFAEIMDEAGVPHGVFNMIFGLGDVVGTAITHHPDIDFISFTGSPVIGKAIVNASSQSLKRLTLELGGKSANIITADADLETAVTIGINSIMLNSGQSCAAPTRMLIHSSTYDKVLAIAKNVVNSITVGDPNDPATVMGPLVNAKQFENVKRYITTGLKEGATLVTGGLNIVCELSDEYKAGYFVPPTIFADVNNNMTIAREEIFGPVLCIIKYDTIEEAIDIANDSIYGLAAYVYAKDVNSATEIANKLRAGQVYLNCARFRTGAPFGGYKQSGIGRESGKYGIDEFLEVKAILYKE